MVLVVCALRAELRYFAARSGVDVIASGVGPVEAAIATARALTTKPYDAVVNAGIAGAFRNRERVGEAVIVETEWLADLGLEGGAELTLPDGVRLIERANASVDLIATVRGLGFTIDSGVTVAQITTTDASAERLSARYAAGVESMEGFAVLRAGAEAGVPALEVRGISNYVGARAMSEWDFTAGARATARALDAVLDLLVR